MSNAELKTEEAMLAFREQIIRRVNDIDNMDFLEFISNMLNAFKEKWGYDMDYKENIIRMISNIQNRGILEYLNRFIELFLEKWGAA